MSENSGGVIALLVREGVLSEQQVRHAERIHAKLKPPRPLLAILKELGHVDDAAIQEAMSRNPEELRLGEMLIDLGLLSEEEFARVMAKQRAEPGRRLGELLLAEDLLSEEQLYRTLALQLGCPLVAPEFEPIDAALLRIAPIAVCRQHRFIPLRREADKIVVAFADPTDEQALHSAQQFFGAQATLRAVATPSSIGLAWERVLAARKPGAGARALDDGAVVAAVDKLIDAAVEWGASDIHIEPLADRIRVRFRADGTMVTYRDLPTALLAPLTSHLKILAGADIAERRRHQGGRFTKPRGGRELDLRASFYVTVHGQKTVLRLLNRDRSLTPIHELGMPPATLSHFKDDALERPSGVILITGPTGSGKTSTLYSCVSYLNDGSNAIITAEDPVEYVIDGVAQCSLNADLDVTYEESLRHIVRQDPDIIVIGEIRDTFSAQAAIQAALTGHKVLSTFHTEDTIGGLVRLLNMEIEAFLISSTVVSVLAQRLLRRVCENCAQPYTPTASDLRQLGYLAGALDGVRMRKGRGCSKCRRTGYSGRIGVFELLVLGEEVREAILNRKASYEIRKISREKGLVSLLEDAIVKAARGETTVSEIIESIPRLDRPRTLEELHRLLGE
jgi:type IV pilus assembly protein PilB